MVRSSRRLIASGLAFLWAWPIIVFSGAANAQAPVVPVPPVTNPSPVSPPATAREGQLETRVQELETIIQAKARREAQLEDRLRRLEDTIHPSQRSERRGQHDRADRADRRRRACQVVRGGSRSKPNRRW